MLNFGGLINITMNKFDFMMYLLFGDKVRSITILLAIIFDMIYFK